MSDDRRVVVIGSGPAGAMAAYRLVRNGFAVTMLETGDDIQNGRLVRIAGKNIYRQLPPMTTGVIGTGAVGMGKSKATGFVITGDPDTNVEYNYALGGLSNQWTGAVPRFCAQDFTAGEQIHEKYRWPVTYSDVAPYYEIAERTMEITADPGDVPGLPAGHCDHREQVPKDWQSVRQVALKRGQGFTTMPLADGPPNLLLNRGTFFNSYSTLIAQLIGKPGFKLITRAHALMLEWDGQKKKAVAAIYCDMQTMAQNRVSGSAFVVACGPLNSPKLLFNSACSDHPDGMGNDAGLLGRYFHDHPLEWWAVDVGRPLTSLSPPAYLTRLPHDSSDPLLASSWTLGAFGRFGKIKSRFGLKTTYFGVQVFGTMVPKEEYYVAPAKNEKDRFGLPALEVHIRFDESVLHNMVKAREHFMQLIQDAGHKGAIREVAPTLPPGASKHYGGTARMHASPKYGVTDGFNRLHDIPNVIVVDASCFTTGAEKNPTLTVMALAARSADRLARDLKAI